MTKDLGYVFALGLLMAAVEQGGADAGGAVILVCDKLIRLIESGHNFIANRFSLSCCFKGLIVQVFQHHHKFITTQTGNGVAFSYTKLKTLCYLLQ